MIAHPPGKRTKEDAVIGKGLDRESDKDELKTFTMRLPESIIQAIDQAVSEHKLHRSRAAWISETLVARLDQEGRL